MQKRLLHALLSGIIIATVLGLALIPATWQMISQEPTFGPMTNDVVITIASAVIIAITLLSFKLVKRAEEEQKTLL